MQSEIVLIHIYSIIVNVPEVKYTLLFENTYQNCNFCEYIVECTGSSEIHT